MLIPNLDFGGAQRVFQDQAKILAEKYKVIECSFNLEGGYAYPSGNQLFSLEVEAGKNVLDKALRFIQRCWRLNQLKKKEKPFVTISHLEGADYVNILSLGQGKKVLVVHGSKVHDQEMDGSFGWLRKKLLLPFLYKQADLIITVSEGIKFELIFHFGIPSEKVQTIYNSFDIQKLEKLASEPSGFPQKTGKKTFRLVTCGRIAKQKNQLSLLYIIKLLKEDYHESVQLFVAGDGPLIEELIAVSKSLGLETIELSELTEKPEAEVVLLGFQANPFRFYKEMDLFLFPSEWEGFPMALGEAMSLGMPVLSSDCPTGPLELLVSEWEKEYPIRRYPKFTLNGVLLPVPKKEDVVTIKIWTETILKVLKDEKLRSEMGKSAQIRMSLLNMINIRERWLNIEEIL